MQEKKLGSPEGQTPPVKLEPTLFGLEVEIQRLVPQAKGGAGDASWQGSQSSGCGRPLRTSSGKNEMRPEKLELPTF